MKLLLRVLCLIFFVSIISNLVCFSETSDDQNRPERQSRALGGQISSDSLRERGFGSCRQHNLVPRWRHHQTFLCHGKGIIYGFLGALLAPDVHKWGHDMFFFFSQKLPP